ncbi:cell wall-binding repeat-containing protein [Clostridium cochlearium]|uniref:cell wall-binding repeat-containing protein n=1 Tax=Clostridium cochlearium TaxID=1494 RepID=UPI001459F18E|nr:cell wall-binding repeat-containing protein [Clostridium cochlearium]NME96237.1 cell wall-binding repeat-containing protein [Clostridium cochlearium]
MKNSKKAIISILITSFIFAPSITGISKVGAKAEVVRMSGANRFITAQNVAKQSFGQTGNIILVNGLGYADAVSAAPLAKILKAPILLTDASKKPSVDLLETLSKLGTKKVYIIGGEGVVTKTLQEELAKTYAVERIAGNAKDGRYGTNAEVAKRVIEKTGAKGAILVSAQGYADALSVASIAATKGQPVIFANKEEMPKVVKNIASNLEVKAVGGEGVLPYRVLQTVNAERIAKGQDRFETNLKVLDYYKEDLNFSNIYVAAGGDDSKYKFADALVASAVAGKDGAPLVLNGLGTNTENRKLANEYIKDNMTKDVKVTIVGGGASIDAFIESELMGKAQILNLGVEDSKEDLKEDEDKIKENNKEQVTDGNKDGEDKNKEDNKIVEDKTDKEEVKQGFIGVSKIEASGLKEIKVVFDEKVTKSSAETSIYYEIDGKDLTYDECNIKLLDDEKTVIITFKEEFKKGTKKRFKVKEGYIQAKNTGYPAQEKEVELTFN